MGYFSVFPDKSAYKSRNGCFCGALQTYFDANLHGNGGHAMRHELPIEHALYLSVAALFLAGLCLGF